MIPENIKSGFSAATAEAMSAEDMAVLKTRMLGLVCLLIKKAAVTAGVFAEHQKRSVVDAPEIILALKHESMQFFQRDTLEADLNTMLRDMTSEQGSVDMVNQFIASSPEDIRSSSADAGEGLVDTVLDVVESELQESLPTPVDTDDADHPCACSLCTRMENIDFLWEAWQPDDPAEQFLKNHLETLVNVV
jgi:3,4-dihydroxy-2-butanone 4-phosphate synthase